MKCHSFGDISTSRQLADAILDDFGHEVLEVASAVISGDVDVLYIVVNRCIVIETIVYL